jgi:hypothetical protein
MKKRPWTVIAIIFSGLILSILVIPKPLDGMCYSASVQFMQDGTMYLQFENGSIIQHYKDLDGTCTVKPIGTYQEDPDGYQMTINMAKSKFIYGFPWLWLTFDEFKLYKWIHLH